MVVWVWEGVCKWLGGAVCGGRVDERGSLVGRAVVGGAVGLVNEVLE